MPIQDEEGVFLEANAILDYGQIRDLDVQSPQFKDFLIELIKLLNQITDVVNIKDTGKYELSEFITGQILYPDTALTSSSTTTPAYRPLHRQVYFFAALANNGTVQQAHGIDINNDFSFISIYGAATKPTTGAPPANGSFIPLPYASKTDSENIAVYLDETNIYITTGDDRTMYTKCYVIVSYVKE